MKRIVFIAAAQFALGAIWAQQPVVSSTRISAPPCGKFYVDGQVYTNSAVFLWPQGSYHTLYTGQSYYIAPNILCAPTGTPLDSAFASCQDAWNAACAPNSPPCAKAPVAPCTAPGTWTDNLGTLLDGPNLSITAHPEITFYRSEWAISYLVGIEVGSDSGVPFSCAQGPEFGKLYVNGTCYDHDTFMWYVAGTKVTLQFYPPRGYVFTGWEGGPLGGISAFDTSVVINSPLKIHPVIEPATPVYIRTVPAGLQVLADRAVVTEDMMPLDWRRSSTHSISVVNPQLNLDTRELWVFDFWGHGGDQTQAYKVWDSSVALNLTANFAPGASVKFLTVPFGLKLTIDGRDNWPSYDFIWKTGSTHPVAAASEQYNAAGRKYAFNSWSIPGAQEMDYVVPAKTAQVLAQYDLLGRLRVDSPAGGVNIAVDGAPCRTPCAIDRRAGVQTKISAPASFALNDSARMDFQSFSDGGPRERTWTAGVDETKLIVNYQVSNRVQAVSDPVGGASFRFDPESPDGFYAADTDVTVMADAKPGYRFKRWDVDGSGTYPRITVRNTGTVYLRAIMERIPYVAPTGVRNAAGDTPEMGVAPGSLISIYGASLATDFVKGPDSPLAQTLGNVSVLAGDRILPLLFVSPGQINAQLPSDLAEGQYRLLVRGDAQPDATANFTVQRNAPGLFVMPVGNQQFAMAVRPNGSVTTTDNPALRGETIVLLGTGFGPYKEGSIDGFAVPNGMQFTLVDPVEILVGDKIVTPSAVVARPGWVGITDIRFTVGGEFAPGTVELKTRVNGHESNKVLLPVK